MTRARIEMIFRWLGRVGIAFVVLLAGYVSLAWIAPQSWVRTADGIGLVATGFWLAIRLFRLTARNAVWRLRNRLLVTYVFISVVPILLIVAAILNGAYLLANQIVLYLATSEFERRIQGLQTGAASIVQTPPPEREDHMARMADLFYSTRYPGIEILLRQSGRSYRYPKSGLMPPTPDGWRSPVRGVLVRDGQYYLWCFEKTESGDVTLAAPLTREFLGSMVPNLGPVDFGELLSPGQINGVHGAGPVPPPVSRFDIPLRWTASVSTSSWNHPDQDSQGYLVVHSRISAMVGAIFDRKSDAGQQLLITFLFFTLGVFAVVEIVSLVIGITMTRTMTGAVHRLYEGTQRVTAGDFSNRIEVKGKDQLAELGRSFNQMTENLEQLLVVAKEKERLQSEIEIAREVQNQLYPRAVPVSRTMRLTAVCQPARMVSGDYYDYENIRDTQIALAIGDVAGKGISAALLMATLQSSLRTQLQSWLEVATVAGNGSVSKMVSTSHVVSRLNSQLFAYTSLEKYATFCLGVYDEPTSSFTYTNAGHLPPLLIREGLAQPLDVNGTVVGAFPFSTYDESRVDLKSGDLLVFFSDGITEPENEYGEMFGEERLTDLIARNCHLSEERIVELVLSSVRLWTASEELQDDMTIMLARRV